MEGALPVTRRIAELLVIVPALFETTHRKFEPLSAIVVAGVVYAELVAPGMLALFFCH